MVVFKVSPKTSNNNNKNSHYSNNNNKNSNHDQGDDLVSGLNESKEFTLRKNHKNCFSLKNRFTYLLVCYLFCCIIFMSRFSLGDSAAAPEQPAKDVLNLNIDKLDTSIKHDEHLMNNENVNAKNSKENSKEDNGNDSKEKKLEKETIAANVGFIHAFFASISVIVVSEIGDKTFFIAAIMAFKHARLTVYTGAMFALGLMTLLSALLGNILTKLIPKTYTYYASSILFALFGLKMLKEGWNMSNTDASDEYEEANSTLRENEEKQAGLHGKDLESGGDSSSRSGGSFFRFTRKFVVFFRKYLSAVFLQAFVLTFLAEWGDRSQISTIILGARENMIGTVLGGTMGHAICTGLAVIGGRFVSQHISVRTVTLVGAFVFLFFAFSAFFIDPDSY